MSFTVAIIGKPNVGKSTLFNRMLRRTGGLRNVAIAEKMPGITRDRNYGTAEWEGRHFTVIDTGGFYAEGLPYEKEDMARLVREQSLLAVEEADLIIHLLDGKDGLNPTDVEMATMLRNAGKLIYWAVNKIDTPDKEVRALEFYSTGAPEIFPVSAMTGLGYEELMDKIAGHIPAEAYAEEEPDPYRNLPKIAVVGRPNVGKSTLINELLGKKRLIVSPVAGTTRDAIDSVCTWYGNPYLFIDTAGIRKKMGGYAKTFRTSSKSKQVDEAAVERLSLMRAVKSIERADIAILLLDATQGVVEQDQRIAGMAEEFGKSMIVLFNKWDLVENPEKRFKELRSEIEHRLWFATAAPFVTTSGLERKRITNIFPLINDLMAERKKHISTGVLNRFLARILSAQPFPSYKGKPLKFYYMAQTGTEPPVFHVVVNYPQAVKDQQLRYIEKAIRAEYGFTGTPIRIYAKSR
ncbi:MAG TPA: ribosome biogenesis GTPase Der [Dissulfurispiraceae bacterium]|nr:ribosome biogenesis GTPase Der [Dissulfurispiraceae bacterium]